MTDARGLSAAEAEARFRAQGPNEIVPSRLESRFSELKRLLLDPMGLMLLGLAGIYTLLGDKTDAIVLVIAFIPVTAVDVILELKAHSALRALKHTLKVTAKVIRGGMIQEVPTRRIVVGDVIVFEEGQSIPADGVILDSSQLQVNEASLTGESVPVDKSESDPFFGGTIVLQGRGLGRVEQVGKTTRFGKIATLLQETASVKSPLQIKVNAVIRWVFLIALGLAGVLFFIEYTRSHLLLPSLVVALTFGMCAIPEEFPLVFTLYLSMGAWRLSKEGVLVKSLPSVETLGSVDVICTDKTGTLTEGRFQLEELRALDPSVPLEKLWQLALMACEEKPIDAMETAIAEKSGDHRASLAGWNLRWDYPFERLGKHMSHVWEHSPAPGQSAAHLISMKGAVEGVLEHCPMGPQPKALLLALVDSLAGQGKRLLGLAYREGPCTGERKKDEVDLRFVGLLVFSDPVRDSARQAIAACQAANITLKMLTGDHPLTAHAVADQTGIAHTHDQLYTGDQLSRMSADLRRKAYLDGVIFSRVVPEQKHEMVQALRSAGKVVAMTGDGINDAPALKLADIGISMGANATDVARSSAQLILLKNDFNGIVRAIFEGRRIFSNLKRSFSYLVSFHVPVVLLALLPPALGWGDLLLPIHIVLLMMVVHPVSAYAFEALPVGQNSREESLLGVRRLLEALLSGTLLSIGCLVLFRQTVAASGLDAARSVALAAVFLGNVAFVFVESWPFQSRRLLITAVSLFALTGAVIWIPALARAFHFQPIGLAQILVALGVGIIASGPSFIIRTAKKD